jgi:hypothetical protein
VAELKSPVMKLSLNTETVHASLFLEDKKFNVPASCSSKECCAQNSDLHS